MRQAGLLSAILCLVACGGATPTPEPSEAPWPKSMADTTCEEWRDNDVMSDDQRNAAARAVVGSTLEVAFVFDINDSCDTLDRLATDDTGPASIADVMELVLTFEDVYQTSDP